MSVWKIGSRWHEHGDFNSSILSIFRRNNIVFVGNQEGKFIEKVKKGDYFAIADGRKVLAVARALTDGKYLGQLVDKLEHYTHEEKAIFDFDECKSFAEGCKVNIVDLEEPFDIFGPGAFCSAGYLSSHVVDCYESINRRFKISSTTYTLLKSASSRDNCILGDNGNTNYVVPVYQRAYRGGEEQVTQFINDIFWGYWGSDCSFSSQEQVFIGTMQFSKKKGIGRDFYEQEIIDGQQRLSTFLLLLKIMALKYESVQERINDLFSHFSFETRVAWPEQNRYYESFMGKKNLSELDSTHSLYEANGKLICELLDTNIESNPDLFSPDSFLKYVTSQVVFVVIETAASLSRTLQIFNTINTAGLDLSTGDLFKLNLYEYLLSKGENESVFTEIDGIYSLIDRKNEYYKKQELRFSINDVLDVYKDYLVSKYELGTEQFYMSTSTFYSRLFDSLLGIKDWDGFKTKTNEIEICIDELKTTVNSLYEWNDLKKTNYDLSGMFGDTIIWYTRYHRYYSIVYQLYKRFNSVSFVLKALYKLCKLFIVYSVRYGKQVNEIHSFMYGLEVDINKHSISEVEILKKIDFKTDAFFDERFEEFKSIVLADVSYPPVTKNLLCLIDTFLYEIERGDYDSIETLQTRVFWSGFDIEHIHATEDPSISIDDTLQKSIGNLTLLESSINRSIGNKTFSEKKIQYADSSFSFIRSLCSINQWGQKEIEERREVVSSKIFEFLKNK